MIRKAKDTDTETLIAIWLRGNIQAHDFIPAEYWTKHIEYMHDALGKADITVYEADGQAVGFAGMEGNHIAGIFVDDKYRSQGIGSRLINHLKQRHDKLTLCAYEKNRRTVSFYLREGFIVTKSGTDNNTGETEITMEYHKDKEAS